MGELAPGAVFAGHRIEALAGRGGMGVVYRATQLDLGRAVALKVVAPSLVEDADSRGRFLRESRLAASIDHPNVIPVYYTGEEDGIAYIAMRFVRGRDLRTLIREGGPLAPVRAVGIIGQVAAALDASHAAGLVHRDVKPANVLLAPGDHVYLSDFGLSKHAVSTDGATRSGHWVGTLDYVAPEQIRGDQIDARADVYALGGVLYFTLTASSPFPREGDEAKMWAHLTERPPRASERAPDVPPALDAVIERAMAKRPDDRYPSAGDLGRAAVAAVSGEPVRERERVIGVGAAAPGDTPTQTVPALPPTAVAGPPPVAGDTRQPRRILVAGAAVVAALVVAAALAIGGNPLRQSPAATPKPPATPMPLDTPEPLAAPRLVSSVRVGRRPNSIAVGDGVVFATNYRDKRLTLIDERTGKLRRKRPTVGVGGRDVVVGFGAAWVAVSRAEALFKLDPAGGRVLARIPLPSSPQTVTVGQDAVWVGLSTLEPEIPDQIVRVDPRTNRVTNTYSMAEGVRALVATPHGLWVVHRSNPSISRVDPATGIPNKRIAVGTNDLGAAAYGAGAVWVTTPLEDTVTRVDDDTGKKIASGVGRRPTGIAAHGNQIWVTSYIDHTITRVDPRTSRPTGRPVPVSLNPYALTVTEDSIWLTALGRGEIAHYRYRGLDADQG